MMMILTKNEYIEELKGGVFQVGFNKVNGEFRDMTCSLREDKIPPRATKGTTKRVIKSDAVRVYDLNAMGWRSFLPANVISFTKM